MVYCVPEKTTRLFKLVISSSSSTPVRQPKVKHSWEVVSSPLFSSTKYQQPLTQVGYKLSFMFSLAWQRSAYHFIVQHGNMKQHQISLHLFCERLSEWVSRFSGFCFCRFCRWRMAKEEDHVLFDFVVVSVFWLERHYLPDTIWFEPGKVTQSIMNKMCFYSTGNKSWKYYISFWVYFELSLNGLWT